jgi:6-phosphogluconate dehydrogenase
MQLGFVGVGRMGAGMIERLRRAGHDVVGYDIDPELSDVASLHDLVDLLQRPRHIWIMVPYGAPIENIIEEFADRLDPGDLVVEGGNSRWTDDGPRAARLSQKGVGFVDCGAPGESGAPSRVMRSWPAEATSMCSDSCRFSTP